MDPTVVYYSILGQLRSTEYVYIDLNLRLTRFQSFKMLNSNYIHKRPSPVWRVGYLNSVGYKME